MQSDVRTGYRLSPQQERLWLLQQGIADAPYRVWCALSIEGDLQRDVLSAALSELKGRYEIIRTGFVSLPRPPQPGSVVWVELADANGFRKVRPAVIVSATADLAAGQPVRVVAITTRLPTPLPDDHVLLPWDR